MTSGEPSKTPDEKAFMDWWCSEGSRNFRDDEEHIARPAFKAGRASRDADVEKTAKLAEETCLELTRQRRAEFKQELDGAVAKARREQMERDVYLLQAIARVEPLRRSKDAQNALNNAAESIRAAFESQERTKEGA